jgi:hypothetical protein
MPEHHRGGFASGSLTVHLTRGALGFGLLGSALALTQIVGLRALLLAVPGVIALRGCPTCWLLGLIEILTARRLRRVCDEHGCGLAVGGHASVERPKP